LRKHLFVHNNSSIRSDSGCRSVKITLVFANEITRRAARKP
jgi:hypothetical protein